MTPAVLVLSPTMLALVRQVGIRAHWASFDVATISNRVMSAGDNHNVRWLFSVRPNGHQRSTLNLGPL